MLDFSLIYFYEINFLKAQECGMVKRTRPGVVRREIDFQHHIGVCGGRGNLVHAYLSGTLLLTPHVPVVLEFSYVFLRCVPSESFWKSLFITLPLADSCIFFKFLYIYVILQGPFLFHFFFFSFILHDI